MIARFVRWVRQKFTPGLDAATPPKKRLALEKRRLAKTCMAFGVSKTKSNAIASGFFKSSE